MAAVQDSQALRTIEGLHWLAPLRLAHKTQILQHVLEQFVVISPPQLQDDLLQQLGRWELALVVGRHADIGCALEIVPDDLLNPSGRDHGLGDQIIDHGMPEAVEDSGADLPLLAADAQLSPVTAEP